MLKIHNKTWLENFDHKLLSHKEQHSFQCTKKRFILPKLPNLVFCYKRKKKLTKKVENLPPFPTAASAPASRASSSWWARPAKTKWLKILKKK